LPVLRQLVAEVGETASLAVMQNLEPCIIQRVEAGGVLQARAQLGTSMALPSSASGRVLVAFATSEEIETWRRAGARFPEEGILREVRRTGVGVAAGMLGVGAVAAPVFDHRMRCVAALSLVGPEARFDVDRMKAPVLAAAGRLSIIIGGQPWAPPRKDG
jgi:DNA-binding IclR family transcriptional regulator